jgi:hypothetical protein
MSRQSKNRRKAVIAKQFTATRKSGGSGPATTTKVNKKVHTWWRKGPGARDTKSRHRLTTDTEQA